MVLRRVAFLTVTAVVLLSLAGCGIGGLFGGFEQRAAWRDQEERACMRANPTIAMSRSIQRVRHINDRGACGIDKPLAVSAMADGTVSIGPVATLGCPMETAVEGWIARSVQPAALAWFQQPIVAVKQISSYSCRPINSEPGNSLSEHAFGNALDVAGFQLADGRTITVKTDWDGPDPYARGFLREALAAACSQFKTVLGPGVKYHGDHFHLDLAHHNAAGTSRYCRPQLDPAPARNPYTPGLLAKAKAWLDLGQTGSIDGGEGELLSEMPADVERREIADPFGAYTLRAPGQ